jgi:hypothetical protein
MKKVNERREELKALSNQVKPLVKECVYDSVNEALIECFYKDAENKEFHTFFDWIDKGYKIKKGSRAFAIWGSPRPLKKIEPQVQDDEKEEDFFPICYLFSNSQVEERKAA